MSKNLLFDNIIDNRGKTGGSKPKLLQLTDEVHDALEKAKCNADKLDSNKATSTTQTTEHTFTFNTGIVSDWWLEISTDDSAVWDVGHYAGFTAIERVEFINGGKTQMIYTGDQLQEYCFLWNLKYGNDTRVLLKELSDRGSGDINNTSLFIPILLPGQHCILGRNNQPINVGLSKDAFTIKIRLRPGNQISKPNALIMDRVTLHWKDWGVEDRLKTVFNKFSMVYFHYDEKLPSVTQSTDFTLGDLTNGFDQTREKELIGVFFRIVSNANVGTEFERYLGAQIESLKLKVGNNELYTHSSTQHAKVLSLIELGVTMTDSVSSGYQYFMSMTSHDLQDKWRNKGLPGVSLGKYTPYIVFNRSGATTTYKAFVTSVYKATYIIDDRGLGQIIH